MSCWTRLPIRQRLTITFAASMAAVITGLSIFVYTRTGADLLDTVDAGLRSRAELLVTDLQHHDSAPVNVEPTLIENDEVFAQIADAAGLIVQSSPRNLAVAAAATTSHPVPARSRALRPENPWYRQCSAGARRAGAHVPRTLGSDGRGIAAGSPGCTSSNWDGPWPSQAQPRSP